MDKLIINNETDLTMAEILPYALKVIEGGRISNFEKQYCYLTTFHNGIIIYADKNKKSDRLIVRKEET